MALTQQQLQQLIVLRQTPAYSGLSQQDAATLASTPVYTPVPYATFQSAVMQLACWGLVRAAAANLSAYPAAMQPVILTAVDLFTNYAAPTVDESLAAFQQALAALNQPVTPTGASGPITLVSDADRAAILALGQSQPIPGVATVALADVQAADAAIALQQQSDALAQSLSSAYGATVSQLNAAKNSGGPLPSKTALSQTFSTTLGS